MVTKIRSSELPATVRAAARSSLPTFGRITKVALAAMALFVVVWLVMKGRRRAPQPPRQQPQRFLRQRGGQGVSGENTIVVSIRSDNHYPDNLVEVLGGIDRFNQLSDLVVSKSNLTILTQGLNPYLKIDPDSMTVSIMRGKDTMDRPFLAVKFKDKGTPEIKVDVFLCRDPQYHRWYLNDERSPETFIIEQGQPLFFLKQLIENTHPTYELTH